ncbi:hypothetical protein Mal35_28300 [Gimesia maris]|uniref:hypothetical protein n=1 Tax=Gimesia maris TaxID=122 RepID=UPI00118AC992|nr:hypothetical protein [Gimesia maris]QDT79372.1 hypothetical protein Mal35_28300 [Gimesia maris]
MMVLLNVFFLLVLFFMTFAVIAAVVWGGLFLAGIRHKRRWLIGSFAVYCLCVAILFFRLSRPAAVFERTFGFAPTAEVIELESSIWILGDGGKITIAFTGKRETVDQILKSGMQRQTDVGRSEHYRRIFSEHFGWESEDLYFNPSTGRVRYYWCGSD